MPYPVCPVISSTSNEDSEDLFKDVNSDDVLAIIEEENLINQNKLNDLVRDLELSRSKAVKYEQHN